MGPLEFDLRRRVGYRARARVRARVESRAEIRVNQDHCISPNAGRAAKRAVVLPAPARFGLL